MCEASKAMKDLVFAKAGDDVVVNTGTHGGGRLFGFQGSFRNCCVPFGAELLFIDMPVELQRRLEIGSEVEVVMMSPDPKFELSTTHRDDEFMVLGDETKRFYLHELPIGTCCKVLATPVDERDEPPAVEIQTDIVVASQTAAQQLIEA